MSSEHDDARDILELTWIAFLEEALSWESTVRGWRVSTTMRPDELRASVRARLDLTKANPLDHLFEEVRNVLRAGLTHVTHPRYFGLFNPSVRPAAVLADALASLYNAQLAVWAHGGGAIELERLALETLGERIGFGPGCHATFTTGGAEANASAVQCALATRFPKWTQSGVRDTPPARIYVSDQGHHSMLKAARMCGLGERSVWEVPTDSSLSMDAVALSRAIDSDLAGGVAPLMVVGTAGATGSGAVDPLPVLHELATAAGAWFHVDAAWGGAASLSRSLAHVLHGIERADSATWDAHKWLCVPSGAGMFFCRHPAAAATAFAITTGYMPGNSVEYEPYASTMQWTRRAIGLKVVLALGELGLDGYARLIDHQTNMAERLRVQLRARGWTIVNKTPLPVICFTNDLVRKGKPSAVSLANRIQARGHCWISPVLLKGESVLRACITSYQTRQEDLDLLISELEGCAVESA